MIFFFFVSQGWNCLKFSSFILNFWYCCQVIDFFKFRYFFFLILILNLKHHKKNCGVKYDPLGMLSSGCITHWRGHRKCWKLKTLIKIFLTFSLHNTNSIDHSNTCLTTVFVFRWNQLKTQWQHTTCTYIIVLYWHQHLYDPQGDDKC